VADARPDFDDNAKLITDGVVTVGTTPTKLSVGASLDTLTEYIIIQNLGDAVIRIGSSGTVTSSTGIRLAKIGKGTLSCITGSEWFAVVDSGTADIYIAEMGS
jgi:hypothetical protein